MLATEPRPDILDGPKEPDADIWEATAKGHVDEIRRSVASFPDDRPDTGAPGTRARGGA